LLHTYHAKAKTVVPVRRNSEEMKWHHEGKRESDDPDIMPHHADSEAWQTLDRFDPKFARDPRSVCLGLSTDGF
jgi:hypothetical protein